MTDRSDEGQIIEFPEPRPSKAREAVGQVLREERRTQDRTLADVAEQAWVSLQYLSEVERGRKEVSSDLLDAVCRSLGIEVADVLERAAGRLRLGSQGNTVMRLLAA